MNEWMRVHYNAMREEKKYGLVIVVYSDLRVVLKCMYLQHRQAITPRNNNSMRSRNVKKVFLQSAALLIGLSLLPSSKPEVYHNIWSTRWQKIPVIYTSLHYHIGKSHCHLI